jgi:hypothetical protein
VSAAPYRYPHLVERHCLIDQQTELSYATQLDQHPSINTFTHGFAIHSVPSRPETTLRTQHTPVNPLRLRPNPRQSPPRQRTTETFLRKSKTFPIINQIAALRPRTSQAHRSAFLHTTHRLGPRLVNRIALFTSALCRNANNGMRSRHKTPLSDSFVHPQSNPLVESHCLALVTLLSRLAPSS